MTSPKPKYKKKFHIFIYITESVIKLEYCYPELIYLKRQTQILSL